VTLKRVATRVLVGVLIGLILMAARVLTADAATYTAPCTIDAPLCERLEATVAQLELANTTLAGIDANTGTAPGVSEVSGVVALSGDDRERSDLMWWGMWALVGLALVQLIAPQLSSLMRVTRGM